MLQFPSTLDSKKIIYINFQNSFFFCLGVCLGAGLEKMNSSWQMTNVNIFHLFISRVQFIGGNRSWFCFMLQFYTGFSGNISWEFAAYGKCSETLWVTLLCSSIVCKLIFGSGFVIYSRIQMNTLNVFVTTLLKFFCTCRIGIKWWEWEDFMVFQF